VVPGRQNTISGTNSCIISYGSRKRNQVLRLQQGRGLGAYRREDAHDGRPSDPKCTRKRAARKSSGRQERESASRRITSLILCNAEAVGGRYSHDLDERGLSRKTAPKEKLRKVNDEMEKKQKDLRMESVREQILKGKPIAGGFVPLSMLGRH